MVRLGQYTLTEDIIERMKKLIERSIEIKKEIGFQLCADKDDHSIPLTTGLPCVGEEHELTRTIFNYSQRCPKNKILIGTFHTHPSRDNAEMSEFDTSSIYDEGIGCIGTKKEINCFVRKGPRKEKISNSIFETARQISNIIPKERRKFFDDNFRELDIENHKK